jgi:NADP-dependent alcohol dehydrogenase
MYNFDFYNPTRIFFGKDRLDVLQSNVPANANVLITFGGGSAVRSGLIAKVKANLGNRRVVEFGGIEPNPQYTTLMKAVEVVHKEQIDFIMAVGGGSVIDGTKFIALAANYDGPATDLLHCGFRGVPRTMVSKTTPFGAVLTLPATGSEMNDGAVISHDHGKFAVMCDLNFPKFSILDPQYTFTLPKIQVANGIVDTFIHTVEQYITFPVDARIQDRWAESILLTLIEVGQSNLDEPENYDARANLVWSATTALNGIIGVGVPQDWTTHMIGHELTARFGIDHGQTLAIVYPAVMDVMREQKQAKLLQYAERVWGITTGSTEEKIDAAIAKTVAFFESLGIKTKLSQYGVQKEELNEIVSQLEVHGMKKLGETGAVTLEVSRKILERAF